MKPETIIDLQTGARYKTEDELGEGATGKVYRARLIDGKGDADVVAAKVAFPNLLASTLADFRAEREKIARLREHTNCVPWAHQGQDPIHPEVEIVLLEFIPDEWQLSQIARVNQGRLSEEIALQSGQQYAQLLIALHEQAGLTMRGDRKLADPRWDTERKRLVVLDWNRAQPLPLGNAKERALLIRQDIRIFAHLWAQLLLGLEHPVPTHLQPDDDAWKHISLGTRLVLTRAFGRTRWGEYATARQLADALAQQWARFDLAHKNPAQLLEEAKKSKEQTERESTSSRRIELAEQVWICADLAERHAPRSKKQPAQELIQWAQQVIEKERDQIRVEIEKWQGDLTKGQFSEVARAVQSKLESIKPVTGYEELLATARRWQMVADFAVAGNSAGLLMQEKITPIASSLRKLDDTLTASTENQVLLNTIEQVQRTVDEALEGLPEEVSSKIQTLVLELDVRQHWLAGMIAGDENKDTRRETAWKKWKELEQTDPLQAQMLRAGLEQFDEYADKVISRQQQLRYEREFTEKAEALFGKLENARNWFDVTNEVGEVVGFYCDHLASFERDITPSVKDDLQILEVLGTLAKNMPAEIDQRDEATALAQIAKLQVPPERTGLKNALQQLVDVSAREHIRYLMDEERMRWLDELEQGLALARAVSDQEAVEYFGAKIARRSALLPYSVQDFLSNLDSKFDDKLDEAEREKIELFDRGGIPPAEAEQLRVANLRVRRNLFRLQSTLNSQIQSYVNEMQSLITDLQKGSAELSEGQSALDEKIKALDDTLGRYRESIRAASAARLQSTIVEYEGLLKRLSEATERLNKWFENWPKLHEHATRISKQLDLWKDFTRETERAIAQVRVLYERLSKPDVTQASSVIQSSKPALGSKPPLAEIVQGIYITAGLEAARRLDEQNASKYLKLADDAKPDDASAHPAGYDLLKDAVSWLGNRISDERKWCDDWIKALDKENLSEADKARTQLLRADPKEFWDFWIVRELNERHWYLTKKWLAEHKEDVERRAQARTDFVHQAVQALTERNLQRLQTLIDGYTESLSLADQGYARQEGPGSQDVATELEVLSGWARRLSDMRQVEERLEYAKQQNAKASSIAQAADFAYEALKGILNMSSDEVFFAYYEEWKRILQNGKNDARQAIEKKGMEKAERGRRILPADSTQKKQHA